VHAFDVHAAIDAGSSVRIGGTETLNTATAPGAVFYFHPTNSPFHVTNVLTTYSRVTSSPGCTVDVAYDTKIPPRFGFHTGAITITAHPDCGANACINFEYLDSKYNAAGNCRIRFSDQCAA
jgi:hypothetical protein